MLPHIFHRLSPPYELNRAVWYNISIHHTNTRRHNRFTTPSWRFKINPTTDESLFATIQRKRQMEQQDRVYEPENLSQNHLFKQGEGYPGIFFLHDAGSSSRIWQPIIDDLSQSYRCYAMDFFGHGASR